MSQQFGNEVIAPSPVAIKSKPKVNYLYQPEVVEEINVKAFCFVAVAEAVIKVSKRKLDHGGFMTAGLLTKWSNKVKNANKKYPTEIASSMQILSNAGFLNEIEVNCRGAINYKVVKLPTANDIKKLTPG